MGLAEQPSPCCCACRCLASTHTAAPSPIRCMATSSTTRRSRGRPARGRSLACATRPVPGRFADGTRYALQKPHYGFRRPGLRADGRGRDGRARASRRSSSAWACSKPSPKRRSCAMRPIRPPPAAPSKACPTGCGMRFARTCADRPLRLEGQRGHPGAPDRARPSVGDIGITSRAFPTAKPAPPRQTRLPGARRAAAAQGHRPRDRRQDVRRRGLLPGHAGAAGAAQRPTTAGAAVARSCSHRRNAPPATARATSPGGGPFPRLSSKALKARPSGPTPTCCCTTWARPGRQPARLRGQWPAVADAAAVGHRPDPATSTATTGCCTTAAPAACSKPSCGTAAKRRPARTGAEDERGRARRAGQIRGVAVAGAAPSSRWTS